AAGRGPGRTMHPGAVRVRWPLLPPPPSDQMRDDLSRGETLVTDIECVLDARAVLGEGPLWDPRDQVLWWVNIKAHEIHRFEPLARRDEVWLAPEDVGSLAVRERGGLVVALASGFHFFDPSTGKFAPIVDPEAGQPENRFNDGKPDRQGRFWAGTMHDPETR